MSTTQEGQGGQKDKGPEQILPLSLQREPTLWVLQVQTFSLLSCRNLLLQSPNEHMAVLWTLLPFHLGFFWRTIPWDSMAYAVMCMCVTSSCQLITSTGQAHPQPLASPLLPEGFCRVGILAYLHSSTWSPSDSAEGLLQCRGGLAHRAALLCGWA